MPAPKHDEGRRSKIQDRTLLVILGPTATGKTSLALALSRHLDIEIISADSAMVYRRLDIGTAKPSPAEQAMVPHHLIDVRNPDESFTAADFQRLARQAIEKIFARGRLPVVAGGTGFYIRTLTRPQAFPAVPPDWELRRRLTALAETKGRAFLHERLAAMDPEAAARLHPNDMQRVIRALEVQQHRRTQGAAAGEGQQENGAAAPAPVLPYRVVTVGLTMERTALYERIHDRSEEQLAAGWLDEVRSVLAAGYSPDCFGLQILGYRQLTAHLQGQLDFAEAKRLLQRDTRHFARRQFIWFRREPEVTWFDVGTWQKRPLLDAVLNYLAGQGIPS